MRKFGKDKPELMAFTIGDSKKVHKIPLAASMPATTMMELSEAQKEGEAATLRYQLELLERYIGDVAGKLTAGDVRDIFNAWVEESMNQGAEPGES